jgi:hypothetical protein
VPLKKSSSRETVSQNIKELMASAVMHDLCIILSHICKRESDGRTAPWKRVDRERLRRYARKQGHPVAVGPCRSCWRQWLGADVPREWSDDEAAGITARLARRGRRSTNNEYLAAHSKFCAHRQRLPKEPVTCDRSQRERKPTSDASPVAHWFLSREFRTPCPLTSDRLSPSPWVS